MISLNNFQTDLDEFSCCQTADLRLASLYYIVVAIISVARMNKMENGNYEQLAVGSIMSVMLAVLKSFSILPITLF